MMLVDSSAWSRLGLALCLCIAAMAIGGCDDRPRSAAAAGGDIGPGSVTHVEFNSIGMALVRIPAGDFLMGSPADEPGRQPAEGPQRMIRITRDFLMGQHEVTNEQFARFVDETGYRTEAERDVAGGFGIDFTTGRVVQASGITWRAPGFPGFEPGPDHPVVLVSWNDAQAFCAWLSRREGRRYGLPTEAQWEYAARGGTKSAWWTGDDPAALREAANIADAALVEVMPARREAEPWSDRAPFLAPVGSYAPNPFGLYDMHGNVWEWCEDEWDEAYFLRATDHDPLATGEGGFRAIRGGGWLDAAERARSAQRVWFDPTFRYCLLSGFRVVVELDPALGAP